MDTTFRCSKETLGKFREVCKRRKVTVKGLIEYLGEHVEEFEIDWDSVRIDNPSNGVRWRRVKETVAEVKKTAKGKKDLMDRCLKRGLSEKQVVAALKLIP